MLTFIHARLATTTQLYFLLMSVWGFWRFFRKQAVNDSYRGGLVIAEILIVLQGVVGVILMLGGASPARGSVHLIYGFLAPTIIPLVHNYTKGRDGRPEILVYGTMLMITAGLIMRAIFTGQVEL